MSTFWLMLAAIVAAAGIGAGGEYLHRRWIERALRSWLQGEAEAANLMMLERDEARKLARFWHRRSAEMSARVMELEEQLKRWTEVSV